jgi:hypothetical protein
MSNKMDKQLANHWDKAIDDAHGHIIRLKTAIAVFEEMKAAGTPWPSKDMVRRKLHQHLPAAARH